MPQYNSTDLSSIYVWIYNTMRLERGINPGNLPNGPDEIASHVRDMLSNERATAFLLVWPIMEQKLFGGAVTNVDDKPNSILAFSQNNQSLFARLNMDDSAQYFHHRYKRSITFYRKLYAKPNKQRGNSTFDQILVKNYSGENSLTDQEKLYLLLFVTYRYRNNIFHGNKEVNVWKNYVDQMNRCIDFMIALINAYIEEHPEATS